MKSVVHCTDHMAERGKEFVFSLKSFLHPRAAESCDSERNWSPQGQIHTKIRNKLGPETTEKFVYVYSNSEIATICDADELKMFAWDNENVQPSFVPCQPVPGPSA